MDESVLERHGDRFCHDSGTSLRATREVNSEVEAEGRQKEKHRRQREAFHTFHKDWEQRQVKKQRTSTPARAEKERKLDTERRRTLVLEQAQMFVQRLRAR